MQKKLLGIAVAAALAAPGFALAQSNVQVYGRVHLSLNNTKFSDDPTGPGVTKWGVNSHASNWGLRSTENLGGGMTAWFQAEFNMQMERRSTLALTRGNGTHRNSGVGLRSNTWGNVYLGTWHTPWAQAASLWDVGTIGGWGPTTSIMGRRETTGMAVTRVADVAPGGGLAGVPASFGGTNLGYPLYRRFSSAVFYESPLWSGVQLKLAIQPNETRNNRTPVATGGENPSAWSGSVTWVGLGGKARAFFAGLRAKDYTTVGQTDGGWTLGGGYDFGVANVGASYETYTYKGSAAAIVAPPAARTGILGDVKAKQWGIGIAVPVGPGKIGASYAKAKQLDAPATVIAPTANDTAAKMWNIGYQWDLSKRTNMGFGVAKITNGNNVGFTWTGATAGPNGGGAESVNPGTSQTNVFVSIRHSF